MRRKISEFLREYIYILSIITIIIGFIITIFGVLGTWFQDNIKDILSSIQEIFPWSPYIFVIGLIILGTGIYYLYMFISKKNFLIKEIETNKRSDFIKNHAELKASVKYLPSKYKELLKQKEKEFKIK